MMGTMGGALFSEFCLMVFVFSVERQQCRVGIDYPELVVFDLDACLWDQEMYEMRVLPSETVTGDLNGTAPCIGVVGKSKHTTF
jgi:hypothetical protein